MNLLLVLLGHDRGFTCHTHLHLFCVRLHVLCVKCSLFSRPLVRKTPVCPSLGKTRVCLCSRVFVCYAVVTMVPLVSLSSVEAARLHKNNKKTFSWPVADVVCSEIIRFAHVVVCSVACWHMTCLSSVYLPVLLLKFIYSLVGPCVAVLIKSFKISFE